LACSNIQTATKGQQGPAGELVGLFRAPVASNYTFIVAADDRAGLWLSRGPRNLSDMEQLVDVTTSAVARDWCHP
jgi:hypothetical protein